MTVSRDELAHYLSELLNITAFKDYGYNGVQVSGSEQITRIASSATASLSICQQASEAQADALLVHHGVIWGGVDHIDGLLRERLASLLAANCNLLAYHLPLDAHPEWGNNRKALDALEIPMKGSFGMYKGQAIGLWGEIKDGINAKDLATRCETAFGHAVVHCPGQGSTIRKVGVVTGGGQGCLLDAHAEGLDALITGEASEQTWHEAAESGCHCFACGHYATECTAVHDLSAHLAKQFGLEHLRIDQHNPL